MLGQNVGKKCENRFLYSHEYREKNWGKRAKQFFQKHTNSATKKCWEKIVGKKCEKAFFIFARISWPKNWGKETRDKFFQKHTNSGNKKFWKKIVGKKLEKAFFI